VIVESEGTISYLWMWKSRGWEAERPGRLTISVGVEECGEASHGKLRGLDGYIIGCRRMCRSIARGLRGLDGLVVSS
jgi:hypothetical protein